MSRIGNVLLYLVVMAISVGPALEKSTCELSLAVKMTG